MLSFKKFSEFELLVEKETAFEYWLLEVERKCGKDSSAIVHPTYAF